MEGRPNRSEGRANGSEGRANGSEGRANGSEGRENGSAFRANGSEGCARRALADLGQLLDAPKPVSAMPDVPKPNRDWPNVPKPIFDMPGFVAVFCIDRRLREAAEARSKAVSQASFAQFHSQPVGEVALGCAARGAVSE